MIWLLRKLQPDFKTIADFKKNKNNLKGDDLGKPESLKHELTGYRSHRIEMEHRLIIVLIRIMFI
ncbi:hypothetical protein CIW83_19895 [Tissierella sp. P1]|nr:hypothetical protein CIW83_19895 [Tissierella sp. P1]